MNKIFKTPSGIQIVPIKRADALRRLDILDGDEKRIFVSKLEPAHIIQSVPGFIKEVLGVDAIELLQQLREIEPTFNEEEDYYAIL